MAEAEGTELSLIADDQGLAVIGSLQLVEAFLRAEGLASRDLEISRHGQALGLTGAATQAGAEVAANAGRWVKLTKESAQLVKKYNLRTNAKTGVSTGALKGAKGQIKGFIEFTRAPGSLLTNPAVLTGAAGIMTQLAMQQQMDEITDYLEIIDRKLDDVLRSQRDTVWADVIGAGSDIDEALTIRKHGGGVNEVTWSKVQGTSATISKSQAYALRQLNGLADKLQRQKRVGDIAKVANEIESETLSWLRLLARCFQLQDGLAVLELDRVLDNDPGDVEAHRLGLLAVRQKRLENITFSTESLLARMDAAVARANLKVLLHPTTSPEVVRSGRQVESAIGELHELLAIETDRQVMRARGWTDAVGDVRDRVLETGEAGLDASKRGGGAALQLARSAPGMVSEVVARRPRLPRRAKPSASEEEDVSDT